MRVALYGPMCSGKTYLANYLVNNYGYLRMGFADKLKEVAQDLFGIDPSNKNNFNRKLLQEFSDDIKKWGGEDIFVKHFVERLPNMTEFSVVCDDLRYPFEAEALRKKHFKIISVNCYENIRQERILKLYPDTSPEAQQHKSEQDYKEIEPDYTVWSNNPSDVKKLDQIVNSKNKLDEWRIKNDLGNGLHLN